MASAIRRHAGTNKSMQTALHAGLFIKPSQGLLHKKGRVIKGASLNFLQHIEDAESTDGSLVLFS